MKFEFTDTKLGQGRRVLNAMGSWKELFSLEMLRRFLIATTR
jgi:hypothetical protein